MLKQNKSFELNKKNELKKSQLLKDPRKYKYLKYIIIPTLLIFFLLLGILMNMKFSIKNHNEKSINGNNHKKNVIKQEINLNMPKRQIFNRNHGKKRIAQIRTFENEINLKPIYAPAISCKQFQENCTLYCVNGNVNFVQDILEELQLQCNGVNLNLIMENCEFTNGILNKYFFSGFFALEYFSINKCNLVSITSDAFTHNNIKNLKTLIMRNNQVNTLEINTFEGLTDLWNFEFVQFPLSAEFKGDLFLKPLANMLKEAIIQPSINGSTLMEPLKWWQGLELSYLTTLDVSNTNFQETLNVETFSKFIALEYLILFNCNLWHIKAEIFKIISNTLKYIDLRYNYLKTLDMEFLEQMLTIKNIQMDLSLNIWNCDCESEMLQYFMDHNNDKMMEEMICSTPLKWEQLSVAQVVRECKISVVTTVTTTVTITSTITSEYSTTSSTKVNTEISTPDPTIDTSSTKSTMSSSSTLSTISTSTPSTLSTTSEIITTIIPPELISINCGISENTDKITKFIIPPNANFSIILNSPTSLTINVQQDTSHPLEYFILYFTNYHDYQIAITAPTIKSQMGNLVYINGLNSSTAYIFCFIKESVVRVSPFDCKAHFMEIYFKTKIAWLLKSDQVWFYAVNITVALILFCFSLIIIYILLRQHPSWLLKHNERILQVHNNPRKVLVLSRKFSTGTLRSSNYLKSLATTTNKAANVNENYIYSSRLTVPMTRAPIKPVKLPRVEISKKYYKSSRSPISRCRRSPNMISQNMDYLNIIENDPEYEDIDYYEAINF